jgi:hypothetical protein
MNKEHELLDEQYKQELPCLVTNRIRERRKTKNNEKIKALVNESGSTDNLCYCGKPVDTTNPDCIDYALCKEHAMDV